MRRARRQSGKRDSNPRPQPWQGCALPTELFPQNPATDVVGDGASTAGASPDDGGEGNRTPDLVNAIHALSQLSYAPARHRSREAAGANRNANTSRGYSGCQPTRETTGASIARQGR